MFSYRLLDKQTNQQTYKLELEQTPTKTNIHENKFTFGMVRRQIYFVFSFRKQNRKVVKWKLTNIGRD